MTEQSRTVLVTGANRGLGLEAARQIAAKGHRIILTARNEPEGYAAAGELSAEGLAVEFRLLDVASDASIEELVAGLRQQGTSLDILINNGAVALSGFNAEVLRRTMAVNYFGAARLTDAILPLVRDGGNIVMVSSTLGELANYPVELRKRLLDPALPRAELDAMVSSFIEAVEHGGREYGWPSSAYNASKAALNALTRIYARELKPRQIRVNAVCPGWVRTDMGGPNASRTVEEGASSIVWAALLDDERSGGFYRDGETVPW
jgi:carbonyl reductase 1